eukprot:TRINITY_DN10281_c0_g1_i1.p2 TRINITY_DN10281_c0_g1~~TRINITY_DN10281_c0_g1_i1.p2  ORF type:complete len:630 (+),score=300.26 TRINITY_DN10281_c0_g1_i1:119-2008(+)
MSMSVSKLLAAIRRVCSDADATSAAKAVDWESQEVADLCTTAAGAKLVQEGLHTKWAARARKEITAARWEAAEALLKVGAAVCAMLQDPEHVPKAAQSIFLVANSAFDCGQGAVQQAAATMLLPDQLDGAFSTAAIQTCGRALHAVFINGSSGAAQQHAGSVLFEHCLHPEAMELVDTKIIAEALKDTDNQYTRGMMVAVLLKVSQSAPAVAAGLKEGFLDVLEETSGREIRQMWEDFWGQGEPSRQRIPDFLVELARIWGEEVVLMGFETLRVADTETLGADSCFLPFVWVNPKEKLISFPDELVRTINESLGGNKAKAVVGLDKISRFACSNSKRTTGFVLKVGDRKVPLDFSWGNMHAATFAKKFPALLKSCGKMFRSSGGNTGGAAEGDRQPGAAKRSAAAAAAAEPSDSLSSSPKRARRAPKPAAAAAAAAAPDVSDPEAEGQDEEGAEVIGRVTDILGEWLRQKSRAQAQGERCLQETTAAVQEELKGLKGRVEEKKKDLEGKLEHERMEAQKEFAQMKLLKKKADKAATQCKEHDAENAKMLQAAHQQLAALAELKDKILKDVKDQAAAKVHSVKQDAEKALSNLQQKIKKESKSSEKIRKRFGSVLPELHDVGEDDEAVGF